MSNHNEKTVVVGMSGGVDSSVTAFLLKEQGYNVIGVFMKNWEETEKNSSLCTSTEDWSDVSKVCSKLDIPFYSMNFSKEYYKEVFEPFLEDYKKGLTPNPDILCNKEIKFKAFYQKALELGADYIATGHYCDIKDGQLVKACDNNKDQTYFLHAIDGSCLDKVLFPLGKLKKDEVRKIAKEQSLPVHNKKDSTGICFIGERNFRNFMSDFISKTEGDFCLLDGTHVGKHHGTPFYTIGQRRQLGLGGEGSRWFVVKKDHEKNIVYVTREENHPLLFSTNVMLHDLTWLHEEPKYFPYECQAKIRYRQEDQICFIEKIQDGKAYLRFEKPQKAVAVRQSVVFYEGDVCLGGGAVYSSEAMETVTTPPLGSLITPVE